jgi:DNA-binding SARP family transcriptional activator
MEFRILGPLEVIEEGRSLPLGGIRQRALLAALLLRANTVVAADRLLDEVWGDEQPASGLRSVHVYVSQLRKLLGGGVIETRSPGYVLVTGDGELDLERFERLVAEARHGDAAAAAAKLREALLLWRGPPLAEFAYASFAQAEIGRLEELRLSALEARIDAELELGAHAEIVGELEALVVDHPLRERLRVQLMLALYRSGRQAEALETYQEGRRLLVDELGIEPGRALRELERAILQQDPSLDLVSEEQAGDEDAERSAFVGRDHELAELVGALDDVIEGRGRLFLLVGEPGIGKSRLAEEMMRRARIRGTSVLVGRCWEAGGAPAYWPWVQSLRTYVRESEPDVLRADVGAGGAELAQILPELRELLPGLAEPAALDSEAARFRLFDATATFLRNAAARRPIVLVLDDLHAADMPSLLLLRFVARELAGTRILLVGAVRDVDPIPGRPLSEMLADVSREPVTRRLALGGLTERDVADYIDEAAAELASPELAAALHEQTEGNPLFLAETVRLLALEGPGAAPAIPESVREVIRRRLDHLGEECNRLLVLAAVLGREFALDALARTAELSVEELLDTLDEAMLARVVLGVPGAPGRLRFAHVLIRDTLYDDLTTARRVRRHRLVVGALEGLYGDEAGPHLAELAHHAIAGSDFERGLLYARRAGDRAFDLLAYEEAARWYDAALEALELTGPADPATRCELLLSLGEAQSTGDRDSAKQTFLDAAEIARRLGLLHELARAAVGYGGRIPWERAGSDHLLVPLLEEALEALPDDEVELRARLLARLAGALRDEFTRERRERLSTEAVELARRTENPIALAYALTGRGPAILAPDTVAEFRALAEELCEVGREIGDPERIIHGHLDRFIAEVLVGEARAADADLEVVSRTAGDLGQQIHLWQATAAQALLLLARGQPAAGQVVVRAHEYGERAQPDMAIPIYRLQRYALHDLHGGMDEVEAGLRDLVERYPTRRVLSCAVVRLEAQLGRTDEARAGLAEMTRDGLATLPFDQEWLYATSLLAEAAWTVEDLDSAETLYRSLVPWAELNTVDHPEGFRGSVSRYLGMLAAMFERWDDAAAHFDEALAMNERMGALPWLAHTERDYGRMLLAGGGAGARRRARELLDRADATYRELGMAPS